MATYEVRRQLREQTLTAGRKAITQFRIQRAVGRLLKRAPLRGRYSVDVAFRACQAEGFSPYDAARLAHRVAAKANRTSTRLRQFYR